jgi:hypothetical protein
LPSDDEFEAFDREFLQMQKAEEERIKREQLDEEFARSFQERSAPSSMNPPSTNTISAFDRLSGIPPRPSSSTPSMTSSHTQIGNSGARKLPWGTPSSAPLGTKSVKSEPRSMTSGIKSEAPSTSFEGFASYASMQNKSMPSFMAESSSSRVMPGSFRDVDLDSDSDIEIIPASEYHDNGRHTRTPTMKQNIGSSSDVYGTQQPKLEHPMFPTEAQISGNAALRRLGQSASNDALQMAMYGKQQGPKDWMNKSSSAASSIMNPFGPGPSSIAGASSFAGGYVYPSAYSNGTGSMLGAHSNGMGSMNAMPGAYPGSIHSGLPGLPGLGYGLNNAHDAMAGFGMNQAGPSQTYSGAPQSSSSDELGDIIRRAGNNYNEISDYLNLDTRNGALANQLDYIMNDPRKTNQEIKELLENIRPDVDLPPEDREGTPEGLVYPLVILPF